jgi:hypothetical protein
MDKPVVRFALSAAVVVAVTLRLFEFIIPCPFGVAREAGQARGPAPTGTLPTTSLRRKKPFRHNKAVGPTCYYMRMIILPKV